MAKKKTKLNEVVEGVNEYGVQDDSKEKPRNAYEDAKEKLRGAICLPEQPPPQEDPRQWIQSAYDYLKYGGERAELINALEKLSGVLGHVLGNLLGRSKLEKKVETGNYLYGGLMNRGATAKATDVAKAVAKVPLALAGKVMGAGGKGGGSALLGGVKAGLAAAFRNPLAAYEAVTVGREGARRVRNAVANAGDTIEPKGVMGAWRFNT